MRTSKILATTLLAGIPSSTAALVYWWPTVFPNHYVFGTNLEVLSAAMRIEWLVMATGLFCIPVLMVPAKRRWIKASFFALFAYTFAYGAYLISGWMGLWQFACLLLVSYGGSCLFIRDEIKRNTAGLMMAIRFVVLLFVFFPLVVIFDIGEGNIANWRGKFAVVQFGATFFSILFLLEISLFAWLQRDACNKLAAFYDQKTSKGANISSHDNENRRRKFNAALYGKQRQDND
jgi:hypothetical protein